MRISNALILTLCQADGFDFCPLVVEAVGGAWGPAATKVLNELAKSKSMITGEQVDHLRGQLYQSLGVILHRENARSVLKRLFEQKPLATDVLSAAAVLQDASGETRLSVKPPPVFQKRAPKQST